MSEKSIIKEQLEKAFWDSKPVSSTDTTGVLQGLPVDNETYDTYAKTYSMEPLNVKDAKKKATGKLSVEP